MTCVMAGLVVVDAQAGRGHPARPTLRSVADRRTGWARWARIRPGNITPLFSSLWVSDTRGPGG
jgi:hypothetical protein